MSDIGETFTALQDFRRANGCENRAAALKEFRSARALAFDACLDLIQYSDSTYALVHPGKGWRLNLYPGNRRIYMDRNRPRAPFLEIQEWSLTGIVQAAIAVEKGDAK